MTIQTWGDVLAASFQQLWAGVVQFLPRIVIAIIVLIIGWIIAVAIGKLVAQIIRALKVDKALQGLGVEGPVSRAGFKLDAGLFLGELVKWFLFVVFLVAALDVLRLEQVNIFLRDVVLGYLPDVIIAALILIIGAVIADLAKRVISGSAKAAQIASAGFLGGVAKWAIWIFALLAALFQLGVAAGFIQTIFTGFIAMLAIAGGLAFGLGGRDAASRYIEKLRGDIKS
jgi:small-conductance mechanosensitive channel